MSASDDNFDKSSMKKRLESSRCAILVLHHRIFLSGSGLNKHELNLGRSSYQISFYNAVNMILIQFLCGTVGIRITVFGCNQVFVIATSLYQVYTA